MRKDTLLNVWFGENKSKNFTILNFKRMRMDNLKAYGNDPDINIKRQWGIRTNGAKKGRLEDKCLDWFLSLGHIEINYTDFEYNSAYRKKVKRWLIC